MTQLQSTKIDCQVPPVKRAELSGQRVLLPPPPTWTLSLPPRAVISCTTAMGSPCDRVLDPEVMVMLFQPAASPPPPPTTVAETSKTPSGTLGGPEVVDQSCRP